MSLRVVAMRGVEVVVVEDDKEGARRDVLRGRGTSSVEDCALSFFTAHLR